MATMPFGCRTPTHPGVRAIEVEGAYRHEASGMVFPDQFGAFERVSVETYDVAGDDVGIGYDLFIGAQVALTIYVYPRDTLADGAKMPLEVRFAGEQEVLRQSHAGLEPTSPPERIQVEADGQLEGLRGRYEFRDDFAGQRDLPLVSELVLLDDGPWWVKYRITYPAAQRDLAERAAADFVAGFRLRDAI